MPKNPQLSMRKAVNRLFFQGYKQIQMCQIMGVHKNSVGRIVPHFNWQDCQEDYSRATSQS